MPGLAFELGGPAQGPLLLLLHGFLGSRRDWAPVAARLSGPFRTLACDLPGHGETADPGEASLWTMAGCAAELARLLRAAGGGPAAVLGYSLGGRLALQLAVEHPAQVAAAVLISASPGLEDPQARAARRADDEALALRLEESGLDSFLDEWYRLPLFAALRGRRSFPEVLERRRANVPRLLARSLRGMGLGCQRSLWEELPGLRAPLLALAGGRDPKFAGIARAMAETCPGAEARIIPGCGHALLEENPAAVAQLAAAFLEAREGFRAR